MPPGVKCTEAAAIAAQADLVAPRREFVFRLLFLEQWLGKELCDQRDLPVLNLLINVVTVTLPSATLVYAVRSHLFGLAYIIFNYTLFLQRFLVALLHVTEHRHLFRQGNCLANLAAPIILAPLFGVPCGMYKLHHKVMHHVENNKYPLDLSSTECFQRDSLPQFFRYWARHTMAGWIEVPLYAYRHNRSSLLCECLLTESAYFLAIGLLWRLNAVATLWVFMIPYAITSIALMFGNWSQHMFLQQPAAGSAYKLTYNCVDCKDNQFTFNDGYHIQHHLNSQLHWSELPQRFLHTIAEHGLHQALVFQRIGVFEVGMLAFLGKLDVLANHMLPCDASMAQLSTEERVSLLQARLRPLQHV